MHIKYYEGTHDSSVGIVTRLRGGRSRIRGLVPVRARYLISNSAARHVTKHTQLGVQCVPRVVTAINRSGSEGDLSLHLVLSLTLRRLMSYIYGAPILDVSRSHTTTQHSR